MGVLWVILPSVVFGVLFVILLPDSQPPSRTRALGRRVGSAVAAPFRAMWRRIHPPGPPPAPDPFVVLAMQMRLGMLTEQMRLLETDPDVWARGRRLLAVRAAYDDLLREACALAGVDLAADAPRDDPERFREEMELTSRGWSW
jgi:hypothetical protein